MMLFKKKKVDTQNKSEVNIQELFKQNLKYISRTEIDVADIEGQFVKNQTRFYLTIGEIDCPSGYIIVADPLCYLAAGKMCPQLSIRIPSGTYPVEVSIFRNPYVGIRMCTARLKIKETKAVKYKCAEPTAESAVAKCIDDIITGFPVDAGLMSFCDSQVGGS